MIENKSAMTPADAGPVHCPVGRLPVKTEPLFAKLIEALSSRHTYTEAEVRLVMLGMQAEIDRANDARRQAHRSEEAPGHQEAAGRQAARRSSS